MKKILTLVYIIAAAALAFYSLAAEIQPALFWVNVFVPHSGDTYPVMLVGLLTFITTLLPLIIILLITKRIRKANEMNQKADGPGIWIIRKKQLQSALVQIPIYINGNKIGGIDSGRIKFFETPAGKNTVTAGKGIAASEGVEFICSANEQPYFKLEIIQSGLVAKFVLYPISDTSNNR